MPATGSTTLKLHPGAVFPDIDVYGLNDETVRLGQPAQGTDWQIVMVYRGQHCALCTDYLNHLEGFRQRLFDIGVDLVAVSADKKPQLQKHLEKLTVRFPLCYGLTEQQMKKLGLYISTPRSEKENNHPFAEPGLFIINDEGVLHVVAVSNNPFVRPDAEGVVSGLEWIRNPDNHYPIRGTYRTD